MDFNEIKAKDNEYIMNTYTRFNTCIVSGKNATLYGMDGKQYIDFTSGIGVNSVGYADENWVKAVCEQAGKLAHISNLYYTLPMAELAEKLCRRTEYKKVFFCNSGAEANECAIKLARKYSFDKYGEGRNKIISLTNSFHGRTMAALTATGQDVFHNYFFPFNEGFDYAAAGDIFELESKLDGTVCAVLAELIQGEGGVVPLEKAYIDKVKELCEKNDILLIIDEVQTGIGRTGNFLCTQEYGIKADIISLAKGLGGGLPLGAVLAGEKTKDTFGYSHHGTTFGGNPIACAGALAVIDTIDEKLLKEVQEKGQYIKEKLLKMDKVESVTGMGLMIGIQLKNIDAKSIADKCTENGLLILTAKTKLRMLPPLTISYEEIDKGLEILSSVLYINLT